LFSRKAKNSSNGSTGVHSGERIISLQPAVFSDAGPLEIVQIELAGKPLTLGQPFASNENWLKDLKITIRNASTKAITHFAFGGGLIKSLDEELKISESYQEGIAWKFGKYFDPQKEKEKGITLQSGEVVELTYVDVDPYYTRATQSERGAFCKLEIGPSVVQFEDGTVDPSSRINLDSLTGSRTSELTWHSENDLRSERQPFRGRIVAYRPVDRISQLPSFAPNKEVFLFKVDTNHGTDSRIVKIEYEYFGLTNISEAMLDAAPLLTLKAKRDKSCDQSYDQFLSTAPKLKQQGSDDVVVGGVEFVENFKDLKIPPKRILPCYFLEKNDFHIAGLRSEEKAEDTANNALPNVLLITQDLNGREKKPLLRNLE